MALENLHKFPHKGDLVKSIIMAGVIGVIAIDAWKVVVTNNDLTRALRQDPTPTLILSDFDQTRKCDTLRHGNGHSQAWRNCALSVAAGIRTIEAAALFAHSAGRWLEEHPGDATFRNSALTVVEAGWRNYASREPLYELYEKAADAHADSIVGRMLNKRNSNTWREAHIRMLESAETAVVAPELLRRQIIRKMQRHKALPQDM